jgi:cytochrome c oxidase subunit 2
VPVSSRATAAAILVLIALILAGSWFGFSGREGLTPVKPVTPGAEEIDDLYKFIGIFAILILLSVAIPLALIIAWYRERGQGREVDGPQIRGNTRLEVTWTVIPVVIVLIIAAVALWKAPGIIDPDAGTAAAAEEVEIAVEGRQFYWRYVYPNGVVAINTLRVPVNRVVDLAITAPDNDVIHSFWAPQIMGKMDAIPGVVNHLKFQPLETGTYDGKCAELCGIQHTAMLLEVQVMEQAEYDRWLEDTHREQQAGGTALGQEIFEGVCATCHFDAPEFAPNITTSPLLGDPEAITQLVENGRRKMPAVGAGWSQTELDSLNAYLQTIAPPAAN